MFFRSKIGQCIWIVLLLVSSLWLIHAVDWLLPLDLNQYGIRPRSWAGLGGIFVSPLLHRDVAHLLHNTIPLAILLFLFLLTQPRPWEMLLWLILLSGALLWLIGRGTSVHNGASTLIFALITYLIASGFWRRSIVGVAVAVAVLIEYGLSAIWGVLPQVDPTISWEGHLSGALVGIALAWFGHRRELSPSRRDGLDLGKVPNIDDRPSRH